MIGIKTVVAGVAAGLQLPLALAAAVLGSPRAAGDDVGLRRFRTPEITPSYRLAQRFTMNADGLSAIEIYPSRDGDPDGTIRLELRSVDGPRPVARTAEVRAADVAAAPSYTFQFMPIAESRDRSWVLEIASSPSAPSRGVSLWATRGARLGGAALFINGRERWADLAFRTQSTQPPPPVVALPAFGDGRVQLTLLGLFASWIAFALIVRERSWM